MPEDTLTDRIGACAEWPERFPPDRWAMYKCVLSDAANEGIRFAVGGGLAASVYGGKWRDSKDIDFYIKHSDLERMQPVLARNGLCDYFHVKSYDRNWIYRTYFRDTIVDVMWAMANQRAQVDDKWLAGPEVQTDGVSMRLLAPEYTLWTKLYVLQFDRSDWPDAMNILYTSGAEMDWDLFLQLIGEDDRLFAGLLNVFAWVCPGRASALPASLWKRMESGNPAGGEPFVARRAELLDSRPWLTPMVDQQVQAAKV